MGELESVSGANDMQDVYECGKRCKTCLSATEFVHKLNNSRTEF